MRRLLPVPDRDGLNQDDLDAAYAVPVLAGGSTHVRSNFVSSVDGAAEVDGRSEPLGSPGDRRVFTTLRWLADVILVGAGTARAEDYGPAKVPPERREWRVAAGLAPVPPIAVVTGSLDLDPAARLFQAEVRPLLLTTASAPAGQAAALREVAELVVCGDDVVDLSVGLTALAARGLPRVLTEGGPKLHSQLAVAGLLDELCVTVAPVLTGPGHLGMLGGGAWTEVQRMELGHALEEDGSLFLRYVLPRKL